jgi:hypothetical protein
MCQIDLDPCEVWSEVARMARKPHDCDGCDATIAKGEAYLSHFSVFEGNRQAQACCFQCWLAREDFAQVHGATPTPGALAEMLSECIAPGDPDSARWKFWLDAMLARNRRPLAARGTKEGA